jgi:hypothetical protein
MVGSYWFKRFVNDAKKISSGIEFKRIKHGFYRIYWKGSGPSAYIGECYSEMPEVGYNIEEKDQYLESHKYYEEYEDRAELTRKIKNFVEGYWESLDRLRTNVYLLKNNKEHRENSIKRYSTFVVK